MPKDQTTIPTHLDEPDADMLMHSGRPVHLWDPSPLDVWLPDWVRGASRVPRWGGQTRGRHGYNDLQHCVLARRTVMWLNPHAPLLAQRWALMHDLNEGAGLGDIAAPYTAYFKPKGLGVLKARLDRALRLSVGLPAELPEAVERLVKEADVILAVAEAIQLMGWPERLARRRVGKGYRGPLPPFAIEPMDEVAARAAWTREWLLLGGQKLFPHPPETLIQAE